MSSPDTTPEKNKPPFVKSWKTVYIVTLAVEVLLIVIFLLIMLKYT